MNGRKGVVLLLMGLLVLIPLVNAPHAKAAVDLSQWKYSTQVTIYNRMSVPLNDFQVAVVLTASNFDFSKAKPNGADIRFVDAQGNLIPYWIEYWNSTSKQAKIWIKVSIPASSKITVRMLYGNPTATYAGNGNAVFVFFDDFNEKHLDTSKWAVGYGNWSVQDGVLIQTAPFTPNALPYIYAKNLNIANGIVEMKFSPENAVCVGCYHVGTTVFVRYSLSTGKSYTANAGGYGYAYEIALWPVPLDGWYVLNKTGDQASLEYNITYHFKFTFVGSHLVFDVLQGSLAGTHLEAYNSSLKSGTIGISSWKNPRVDWIFVRKYAKIEPQVVVGATSPNTMFSSRLLQASVFWYLRYQQMHEEYPALYQMAVQHNVSNETLSLSKAQAKLAEEYFSKISTDMVLKGNIMAVPYIRKAYLHMKAAIDILEDALNG